ncbi:MAG: hypothetical protein ACOYMH_00080 [Zwartia sp.]
MPNIVNVEVSQQVAPAPSKLQQTGAFISQGATTLAPGESALLTQLSDLSSILTGSVTIDTITWSTGVVTVTTLTAHGIQSGDTIPMIISGCTPTGYNGTFAATYVSSTSFTYPLAVNPGLITTEGVVTLEDVQELVAMNNTFFAQGQNLAVYVLELGSGTPADGVTELSTYLANPTIRFYSYLLPKNWDTESTMVDLATQYNGTTAQTYFYVTTTLATYTAWDGIKSVFAAVQSPTAPITEFSLSAMFRVTLAYNPNASNLAHPLAFSYIYGVTAYTLTNTQQTQLKAAGVNWVGTGAEGGISNTIIFWGTFMDLSPFNYWYAVDWLAINVEIALANAIINGSNLPTNPLYYNQNGINTLQKVAQATVNNGIAFGMILSPAAVEAVSFITYVTQNPSDYATGTYNGLSVTFVPARGFTSITIYLTASNIPV